MLSITLRQLEYAVAVARTGGVTAAAETLNVSQPALSVALSQLEAQLGQPLFLRRAGSAVTPTAYGRSFVDEAERLLLGIANLTRGTGAPSPVTLGCFEDLAPMVLAPLLARIGAALPGLAITPRVGSFERLAEDLSRGRIDLALSYDLGFDERFEREEIARLTPHAVLSPDHPLALAPGLRLADLADQPLVLADQGPSLGHMQALFSRAGLMPRIAHRTHSLETMRSFAANGLGIGLSYTHPAPGQSYDGRPLVTRPVTDTGAGEPIVLVRLAGMASASSTKRVSDFIRKTALPF
ncbi:LysR family transcriptional regulator [Albidovulum sediminis]|uniref:LysR family transcriptional regulator n=1 Tax=Albidovulum sediminis TaxID=3066345 RepID=A0ABT2NLL8_9RHOB|nr:LysR family transcriptional regulator [Defluviimonas sediminis]